MIGLRVDEWNAPGREGTLRFHVLRPGGRVVYWAMRLGSDGPTRALMASSSVSESEFRRGPYRTVEPIEGAIAHIAAPLLETIGPLLALRLSSADPAHRGDGLIPGEATTAMVLVGEQTLCAQTPWDREWHCGDWNRTAAPTRALLISPTQIGLLSPDELGIYDLGEPGLTPRFHMPLSEPADLRVQAEGCLRLQPTAEGAPGLLDGAQAFHVGATGLLPIARCSERTLLSAITLSPDLPEPARACFNTLNARALQWPSLPRLAGDVRRCGSARDGHSWEFISPDDPGERIILERSQFAHSITRSRRVQRGRSLRIVDETSTFEDGVVECTQSSRVRARLDRHDRPVLWEQQVERCEGEYDGRTRTAWTELGDAWAVGHERQAGGSFRVIGPEAEASCSAQRCACQATFEDEDGHPRITIWNRGDWGETLYDCGTFEWPESSDALIEFGLNHTP